MGGGEDPSLVDEHAPAPMADVAQGRQGYVHRHLKNVAFTQTFSFSFSSSRPTHALPDKNPLILSSHSSGSNLEENVP